MKRVNIIIDRSKIIYYHIFPLLVNHARLIDIGIKIKFFYRLKPNILDCDVLILLSKPVFNLLNEKKYILNQNGPILKFLENANKKVSRVIWMDTSDSTSTTHFEILPFVHRYLKKQMFRDKSLYRTKLYGGRIFTQFYNQKFCVEDNPIYPEIALLDDGEDKLGISWNIGLGDMVNAFSQNKKSMFYGRIFNFILPKYDLTTYNNLNKNLDILLKTTINLSRNTVAFHRKKLVETLIEITKNNNLNSVIQGKRLSSNEFRKLMSQTKIFPSPFGWGEIGVRDYEAFIYGGLLLKPSVDHMETWPDLFLSNSTYIPFKWDFSDIEEKINLVLENKIIFKQTSEEGQRKYLESISHVGMENFTNRFKKCLED